MSLASTFKEPRIYGWPLFRDGEQAEAVREALLKFNTRQGEQPVLTQPGKTPAQWNRTVLGPGAGM